jgi:hypothetical protein
MELPDSEEVPATDTPSDTRARRIGMDDAELSDDLAEKAGPELV